ncbi:MAG: hypothetical protein NTX45_29640 [Proteobacteria bacterium]|nr:hypothetical protein [Pseudomonadota bacterium]
MAQRLACRVWVRRVPEIAMGYANAAAIAPIKEETGCGRNTPNQKYLNNRQGRATVPSSQTAPGGN